MGYPLLAKAAGGGGGIGMRFVNGPDTLAATLATTQALALKAFGDGSIYLERYVARATIRPKARFSACQAWTKAVFSERKP